MTRRQAVWFGIIFNLALVALFIWILYVRTHGG
jgi:hypothetical protein